MLPLSRTNQAGPHLYCCKVLNNQGNDEPGSRGPDTYTREELVSCPYIWSLEWWKVLALLCLLLRRSSTTDKSEDATFESLSPISRSSASSLTQLCSLFCPHLSRYNISTALNMKHVSAALATYPCIEGPAGFFKFFFRKLMSILVTEIFLIPAGCSKAKRNKATHCASPSSHTNWCNSTEVNGAMPSPVHWSVVRNSARGKIQPKEMANTEGGRKTLPLLIISTEIVTRRPGHKSESYDTVRCADTEQRDYNLRKNRSWTQNVQRGSSMGHSHT